MHLTVKKKKKSFDPLKQKIKIATFADIRQGARFILWPALSEKNQRFQFYIIAL
jgi:hypothetical protein